MDGTAKLIRKFVTAMNSRGLEPLFDREVPEELRIKEVADISGMVEWGIRPASDNPWVSQLEARLPSQFPLAYRFLIMQFRFAEFEVGPVMFFANTGQESVLNDISHALFADKHLYPMLLKNSLIQFGRQSGGGYDPVCFDMKRRRAQDAPIVQLDHEEILVRNRIRIIQEVATSFSDFATRAIAGEFPN